MNRVWFLAFGDFISFWGSFYIILLIRFGAPLSSTAVGLHFVPFAILYLFWILSFFLFGLYDLLNIKPTIPHFRRFGLALIVCFIVGIFLFYFVPIFGIAPKTNLLFQIGGFGLFSFLLRRIVYSFFSQQIVRPVILVGKTPYLDELHTTIQTNPQLGLKVISYTTNLHESLETYASIKNSVFIFEGISNEIPGKDIVNLYQNKTEIIDIAEAYERYLYKIPVGYISQSWVIENVSIKQDIVYDAISRVFNIIISIGLLLILSPFLILAMIARLMEDGRPIFIRQKRVGKNGKIFNLYKLRSMIALLPDGSAETNGVEWAGNKDSRITPLGHILRRTHIDEIPQMINILRGDITLVGPRPERPEFVTTLEKSIPHYELRHIIRPGFTGWAQIKYRYARTEEDSKEKFQYDLYYIKNRNIFLDFGIIIRTLQIIFTH